MTIKEYERVFKALANRRRLHIISYLLYAKESSVGSIAAKIKLSFKSTSKHLNILLQARILEKEQKNLSMSYSIQRPLSKPLSEHIAVFAHSHE